MMESQREAYRAEAYELLAELETSLLALEEDPGDMELIGRVFRALHTIKGSGAMFGFDDTKSPKITSSHKQRKRLLEMLKEECRTRIHSDLKPVLEKHIHEEISSSDPWCITIAPANKNAD